MLLKKPRKGLLITSLGPFDDFQALGYGGHDDEILRILCMMDVMTACSPSITKAI
jgi:hypothetical protein